MHGVNYAPDDTEVLQCPECPYTSNNSKKNPYYGTRNLKKHECPKCELKMTTAMKVRQHIKTVHDKIKDCICEHCGAAFSARSNLQEHVKVVHYNIREYRCDECGFEVTTRTYLRKHLIVMNHTSTLQNEKND